MPIGYWPRPLTISSTRSGVSGRPTCATPSASATALAMHTGVLIEFPSATPLAPSGVTGEGVPQRRGIGLRKTSGGPMPDAGKTRKIQGVFRLRGRKDTPFGKSHLLRAHIELRRGDARELVAQSRCSEPRGAGGRPGKAAGIIPC